MDFLSNQTLDIVKDPSSRKIMKTKSTKSIKLPNSTKSTKLPNSTSKSTKTQKTKVQKRITDFDYEKIKKTIEKQNIEIVKTNKKVVKTFKKIKKVEVDMKNYMEEKFLNCTKISDMQNMNMLMKDCLQTNLELTKRMNALENKLLHSEPTFNENVNYRVHNEMFVNEDNVQNNSMQQESIFIPSIPSIAVQERDKLNNTRRESDWLKVRKVFKDIHSLQSEHKQSHGKRAKLLQNLMEAMNEYEKNWMGDNICTDEDGNTYDVGLEFFDEETNAEMSDHLEEICR